MEPSHPQSVAASRRGARLIARSNEPEQVVRERPGDDEWHRSERNETEAHADKSRLPRASRGRLWDLYLFYRSWSGFAFPCSAAFQDRVGRGAESPALHGSGKRASHHVSEVLLIRQGTYVITRGDSLLMASTLPRHGRAEEKPY